MSKLSLAPDFLADLLAYIEVQRFEPPTGAKAASVADFSPCHFSGLFTARFGESVLSYVPTCRLQANDPGSLLRMVGSDPAAPTHGCR